VSADKRKTLSQWNTPPWVAEAMWARAKIHNHLYVLEPSAGTGALILPVDDDVAVTACEIDPELCAHYLRQIDPPLYQLHQGDFLTDFAVPLNPDYRPFGTAVMNPPFEAGKDLAFVLKAFRLCEVVIALVRVQFLHRTACWKKLWSRPDVCLSWVGGCIPRPRFGGAYNPMDEYVIIELVHGPQTTTEYARILNPKLLQAQAP